uniref:Uncharacterized protein n=1 Tax=Peronospora matthiolae TaxID=2874970 RepID=A0AAV1T555_9STRA
MMKEGGRKQLKRSRDSRLEGVERATTFCVRLGLTAWGLTLVLTDFCGRLECAAVMIGGQRQLVGCLLVLDRLDIGSKKSKLRRRVEED